ncbi:MAG: hypothetical protein U0837_17430 [Dehalococcoidia bacterium]
MLTDTVGFIQKLPTQLVAAFRATLKELAEADLLLHVIDISHPNAFEHWRPSTRHSPSSVWPGSRRCSPSTRWMPFATKTASLSRITTAKALILGAGAPRNVVLISAQERWGLDALRRRIEDALDGDLEAGPGDLTELVGRAV